MAKKTKKQEEVETPTNDDGPMLTVQIPLEVLRSTMGAAALIPTDVFEAIQAVAAYGTANGEEQEDYEVTVECGEDASNHIWVSYKKMCDWLDQQKSLLKAAEVN
jgi:hypothetical protein